jgi:pimeloyl-ACP methyl ester carboxylesterase
MPATSTPASRIDARGLTFDVHAGGAQDGPPVLLLHGFPQHSGEWTTVLPALHAAGLRSYALDQRGYSPGARPTEVPDYRIAECVADAVAVLDALGIDAAHLVGHDWGALVAWHLAARHPDRVRTLTAVSVPHPAAMAQALSTDPDQRERSSYITLFRQAGVAERVLLADDAAALRGLLAGVGAGLVEAYAEPMLVPGALTAALNWYRAMTNEDLAAAGPVGVPTTFVWSDGDAAIGRTAAEACAAQVTGPYEFVALPGVTHWIPDEAPASLAEAILARTGGR